MQFTINPLYKGENSDLTFTQIEELIHSADTFVKNHTLQKDLNTLYTLIGKGNNANGQVYLLPNPLFCIKVAKLSKHVGKNQQMQFQLTQECQKAIQGKSITIEGNEYSLATVAPIAVFVNSHYAYTVMYYLQNTVALWDEKNIPFQDKDNWPAIREIKRIIKNYGKKTGIGAESFLNSMDINGNNLLVDIKSKIIYLIDPYVPRKIKTEFDLIFEKKIMESWLYYYLFELASSNLKNWCISGKTVLDVGTKSKSKTLEKQLLVVVNNEGSKVKANEAIKKVKQKNKVKIEVIALENTQHKTKKGFIRDDPAANSIGVWMNNNNELFYYSSKAMHTYFE